MKSLLVFDVGGTSIKHGVFDLETHAVTEKGETHTPKTLDEFYATIDEIKQQHTATAAGAAFSLPGAVDPVSGVIGGVSALPYIHHFPIRQALAERLGGPVTIENDANCAAYAELAVGAAREFNNVAFIVLGTGIGGAVIVNRELVRGSHLMAGEFGLIPDQYGQGVSRSGTIMHAAEHYSERTGQNIDGRELLALWQQGDSVAAEIVAATYQQLSRLLFGLQYTLDPEAFIIGGGVSQNSVFIRGLSEAVTAFTKAFPEKVPVTPKVIAAELGNEANLVGAAFRFLEEQGVD